MKTSLVTLLCVGSLAWGSGTASWEMNTYADFLRGRFSGVSLSRDGRMMLSPRLDTLLAPEQPAIWSIAQAPDGSIYVGTGHGGQVHRVDPKGKSTLFWTAPEPEVFALAVGPDGAVYAGTSPDGKVYRIQNGSATPYFAPGARYIWSIAFDPAANMYVGTGDNGKIFRVAKGGGPGEVYYDTAQSHVTCLALDREGRLLAGTEPNGILYRIEAKDKAFVLYDANLPEIRTVAVAPDGTVYAAALGGSVAQRTSGAGTGPQTTSGVTVGTPTTTITVTDEAAAQAGVEIKPKPPETPKAQVQATITPGTQVYSAIGPEIAGIDKSAIYKINLDNTVETLWTSKEENAYDLLLAGDSVLFSTDGNGRIYKMGPDRRLTLVVQTNEGEATRLLNTGSSLLAATSSLGKLYKLSDAASLQGNYESPVHDAGSVARWGQIAWRGQRLASGKLVFRTRSGNSARPDRTWSNWSEPLSNPDGSNVGSPNSRFVQWRAEFAGDMASSPSITGVTVSYLPQNNPPVIRSINVTTQTAPITSGNKGAAAAQASTAAYSITVTDTSDAGVSTVTGTPAQVVSRGVTQQLVVTWAAEDPDGDRLSYWLYFRGEEETQWKLLRGNFSDTTILFEGDVFADGKYLFRVVASDRQSNPAASAREGEMVSPPVLFDNTPPVVSATAGTRNGSDVEISIVARDAASAIRRAEYSLDASSWVPIEAADGVIDGREERFTIRLTSLTSGEHLLVIRAFDWSNNAGLRKVLIP